MDREIQIRMSNEDTLKWKRFIVKTFRVVKFKSQFAS